MVCKANVARCVDALQTLAIYTQAYKINRDGESEIIVDVGQNSVENTLKILGGDTEQ